MARIGGSDSLPLGLEREGGPAASSYGEAECREEGGECGERDVDDYAPAVLAFLGHNGFGWFGGFMSRSLRLM